MIKKINEKKEQLKKVRVYVYEQVFDKKLKRTRQKYFSSFSRSEIKDLDEYLKKLSDE